MSVTRLRRERAAAGISPPCSIAPTPGHLAPWRAPSREGVKRGGLNASQACHWFTWRTHEESAKLPSQLTSPLSNLTHSANLLTQQTCTLGKRARSAASPSEHTCTRSPTLCVSTERQVCLRFDVTDRGRGRFGVNDICIERPSSAKEDSRGPLKQRGTAPYAGAPTARSLL